MLSQETTSTVTFRDRNLHGEQSEEQHQDLRPQPTGDRVLGWLALARGTAARAEALEQQVEDAHNEGNDGQGEAVDPGEDNRLHKGGGGVGDIRVVKADMMREVMAGAKPSTPVKTIDCTNWGGGVEIFRF